MTEERRIYSKVSLEKEVESERKDKVITTEIQATPIIDIQDPNYKKADIEILPKAFIIVISGGEVREKEYFNIISNTDKFKRIKLEFIADPNKLSPDGMYEIAEYKKDRYKSSKNEDDEPDAIYLVSDMDHFFNELIRIKPKCEKENFNLIISNSCYEVWLYYAYRDDIPTFTIPKDKLKISSKFKGWIPQVIPGGIRPNKAILNIYANIENAKKNYKIDENGIPTIFSSNMFLLAEAILPLIEPELTKLIEEIAEKQTKYRQKKIEN